MSDKIMSFDFLGGNAIDTATHISQLNRYAAAGARMGAAAFERDQRFAAKVFADRLNAVHDIFNSKAHNLFPNKINQRWHLINELLEVLDYPARPNLTYLGMGNGQAFTLNLQKVKKEKFVVYDTQQAGDYYYRNFLKTTAFHHLIGHMLKVYSYALSVAFNHYPDKADNNGFWSVKDYIARELVDRLHRLCSVDVVSGVQPNFFDNQKLYLDRTCQDSLKLLDLCYSRLEDIDSGVNGEFYRPIAGENYVRPMPAPAYNPNEAVELNETWESLLVPRLKDYFSSFETDIRYYDNPIFLATAFTDVLDCMTATLTPFGGPYQSPSMPEGKMLVMINHIREHLEIRNLIRTKGQMLAAVSYVLGQVFDKVPECQPLLCWLIYNNLNQHYVEMVNDNVVCCDYPDREPLFQNSFFLNKIFFNNDNSDTLLDESIAIFTHAEKVMQQIDEQRKNGVEKPVWNFRRGYQIVGEYAYDSKYRTHMVHDHVEMINDENDIIIRELAPKQNNAPIRPQSIPS